MSFGQQSGPPASAKQLQYLLSLLKRQGYEGFRDARGPLGLTQRQGNGKFTTREASALIEQLLGEGAEEDDPVAAAADTPPARAPADRAAARTSPLAGFPTEVLADELRRRGWTVHPPAGAPTGASR